MAAGGLVQHVPSCVAARQPSAPSCVAPSQGHVNIKNPQPSALTATFFLLPPQYGGSDESEFPACPSFQTP